MERPIDSIYQDVKLLSLDVDNTLIDLLTLKGSFTKTWQEYKPANGVILAYNTGRLINNMLKLIEKGILPEPDYIIAGVGTHIYDFKNQSVVKEFDEILEEGWTLDIVEATIQNMDFPIKLQPGKFQHAYKRSYFFHDAKVEDIRAIEQKFQDAQMDINVIYSDDKYLDILPKWANKGNALKWLLNVLHIPTKQVVVAGDSGNDAAMFNLKDIRGITVANAHEELYRLTKYLQVYHSEQERSEGVIEGLIFYGVLPEAAMPDGNEQESVDDFFVNEKTDYHISDEKDEKLTLILEGYEKAINTLRKNITPLGFSACSIEDNIAQGTDENYHSVWARDGAITVLGSLSIISMEDIHQCQRQTLLTLLENISPNGQIPSNVRIKDGASDYSGVGGICSIDSGLWFIIAFYGYIQVTKDLDFLRTYISELQQVMDWLSAHDGNNDALLEIPEAGDWTDLFGRSYNILYDEILWYRTNVCYGRLLEMLGEYKRAGDYLRWSQVIKKEILQNFWPSTQQGMFQSVSFAEQQYSLGDTPYLIAQVTPFDFSWRCDTFGNILAFLYNVIDRDKANRTFYFMLGVGINDPYPVSNVYPVVNPGDPDWRPYYTVNLLNLPHHYHNGGIWPFIGGLWVQFIDKLGLREMALSELYKLALLNKEGMHGEWEFTEWAHGKTGRPMGKIFQAWSAAQYIDTCYKLNITK